MRTTVLAVLAAALLTSACDKTGALGDANSIIVALPADRWAQVEGMVREALEPTVFTVTDEKAFTVTQTSPGTQAWTNLRGFKQMLVIGHVGDPWVDEALAEVDSDEAIAPPQILQAYDVWARAQLVTVALLTPDGDEEGELAALLPRLAELYTEQYHEYAVNRMYFTGRDSALVDTLSARAGFSVVIPEVYSWRSQDSVYVFRNDNPDPSELIRQVAVAWRSPVPAGMSPEFLVDWRNEIAAQYYEDEQVLNLERVTGGPGQFGGLQTYQIQAAWENAPGGWPAGGPVIMRAVICPSQERVYLVDGWLYAPGREKYEYLIQLQTIMDTFRCG